MKAALAARWTLSRRLLLAIYVIVPLAWLAVIGDLVLFDGGLRRALPESPEELAWFTAFFVLPHILASQFSFYDREYLGAYRLPLLWGVPFVLAGRAPLRVRCGYRGADLHRRHDVARDRAAGRHRRRARRA